MHVQRYRGAGYVTINHCFSNATENRCVLSRRRKTGKLFASVTEVGRLFQIDGTAKLKARLPYAVRVRGTWSRGRVDERKVIDEPECWLEISWWSYTQSAHIHDESAKQAIESSYLTVYCSLQQLSLFNVKFCCRSVGVHLARPSLWDAMTSRQLMSSSNVRRTCMPTSAGPSHRIDSER